MISKQDVNGSMLHLCKECGGNMILCKDDMLFTTLPTQVKYICRECGNIEFVCACKRKGE